MKAEQLKQQTAIRCQQLSFAYRQVPVLSSIDFSVERGELVVLIGANGAGKSTLMRLLLGELLPSEGAIELFGVNAKEFKQWSKIGYLPQNAVERNNAFPANVFEIVRAHLYAIKKQTKLSRKEVKQKVAEALDLVEMTGYEKRMISHLSGGQQQRVMLAGVLAAQTELMLLDEPTVGLDRNTVDGLYQLLKKLCSNGMSVLLITHDMHHITEYANRVYCLENGTLVKLSKEQIVYELSHRHEHPHNPVEVN